MNISCENARELLPELYNGTLGPEDRTAVEQHLHACRDCSAYYAEMQPIFDAAREAQADPDRNHLPLDQLQRIVFKPGSLSDEDKRQAQEHLASCDQCRQLVDRLRQLPLHVETILTEQAAPLLSSIDREFYSHLPKHPKATLVSTPVRYLLFAAVLIVALVSFWRTVETPTENTQLVVADLPVPTRSMTEPIPTFAIPNPDVPLLLRYPVQPEAGHRYNFTLEYRESRNVVQKWRDYQRFDTAGRFVVKVPLRVGTYSLVMDDIVGADTIQVERPFDVVLRGQ